MSDGFGDSLRLAIHQQGLTQKALAEGMGVSIATMSEWVRGVTRPSPAVVFSIEKRLSVPPGYLSRHLGYLPVGADTDFAGMVGDVIPLLEEVLRHLKAIEEGRS